MKIKLLLFCVLLTLTTCFSQNKSYGEISYEEATNISGKQRMLSQRIAKIKVLNLVGITSTDLKAELNSSIILFERNLEVLELNSQKQSNKVKSMIRKEKSEWNKYIIFIKKTYPPVEEVLTMAESLLSKCHDLVLAIEEDSKNNKQLAMTFDKSQLRVEIVNLAGSQRMRSQKLCLYYAAYRAFEKGEKAKATRFQYTYTYTSMDSIINILKVIEINDPEIDLTITHILNLIDKDIKSKRKDFIDNKIPLETMISTTNKLLELFDKLTSQYAI